MELLHYPNAIATAELQVLAMSKEIDTLTDQINAIECEVDLEIAQDSQYKNDVQRKGAKSEKLNGNKKYKKLLQALNIQQGEKKEREIHVRKLANQFTIAKLELQLKIAQMNQTSVA